MVGGGEPSSIEPDAEDLERGERRRDAPEFVDGDDGDEEESQYFSDVEDRSWPSHSRHNHYSLSRLQLEPCLALS